MSKGICKTKRKKQTNKKEKKFEYPAHFFLSRLLHEWGGYCILFSHSSKWFSIPFDFFEQQENGRLSGRLLSVLR